MRNCNEFTKLKVLAILLLMCGVCTVGIAQNVDEPTGEEKGLFQETIDDVYDQFLVASVRYQTVCHCRQ